MRKHFESRLDKMESEIEARIDSVASEAEIRRLSREKLWRGTRKLGIDIDDPDVRQALVDNCRKKGWMREAEDIAAYPGRDVK